MKLPAKAIARLFLVLSAITAGHAFADAQTTASQAGNNAEAVSPAELLKKLDQLVDQNGQLEKQNKELMDQIAAMRQMLAKQAGTSPQDLEKVTADATPSRTPENTTAGAASTLTGSSEAKTQQASATLASGKEKSNFWSPYTLNQGYKIANTEYGDVNLSIYAYGRYLNQRALEPTYTNAFGVTSNLQRRQDFQLNKVQIKFLGWAMSPKFRYFLYAWTSNATQGQGAQVVLAGNLNYTFNKYLTVGAGIFSLPGARSVEGNFPFWLSVDSRLIADEFFRPSYSSGIKASGTIAKGLTYQAMVANNRSTLGVSAAQLPNRFNTISSVLVWMPKGEYGPGWGDFENNKSTVTRFGFHFNHSDENKQSQPNSDSFENVQMRLSDGSVIFTPNLFGPGITITDARYKMVSFDAGIKRRGFALEGEYYWQWFNDFRGTNTSNLPTDYAYGYQLQASAMLKPKSLQLYAGGSEIIGQYGRPWDFRAGANYFPFGNKVVRWNSEFLYVYRSPVGYSSVPYPLGGTGPIFHTTLELAF